MEIWKKCWQWQQDGDDCVLITVIKGAAGSPGKSGFKMVFSRQGKQFGTVGGGAIEKQAEEAAAKVFDEEANLLLDVNLKDIGMTCGGTMSLFCEYLPAEKRFVLFGAGHIGQALAPLLESIGYSVTLFDDRPDRTALEEAEKGRKVIIGSYEDIEPVRETLLKAERAFIATHGHAYDQTLLRQIFKLGSPFAYLGMIGSRSKIAVMLKELHQEGLTPPENFFAPVGLSIGGDSAAEIALGIAAEVTAVKYGKPAYHMNSVPNPVHGNRG